MTVHRVIHFAEQHSPIQQQFEPGFDDDQWFDGSRNYNEGFHPSNDQLYFENPNFPRNSPSLRHVSIWYRCNCQYRPIMIIIGKPKDNKSTRVFIVISNILEIVWKYIASLPGHLSFYSSNNCGINICQMFSFLGCSIQPAL